MFLVGQQVRAVSGVPRDMAPAPQYVGQEGTVTQVITDRSGQYFRVDFGPSDYDYIDAACLQAREEA